jgi:L-threonylcarbamoyladenylate synthase
MQHRGTDLILAKKLLTEGKLVAIPTETVYGLAANGLDETAVAGIFLAKNRPTFDPLILHVASIEQAQSLCTDWPEMADKLARAFWPGPLTLVLPKADHVPDLTTSGQPTVGIRMPNNRLTLELLSTLPFPLAAPSANPFGYVSPTNAQHVADQLGDRIDYILDDGDCSVGIESTIIAIDNGAPKVLRLGGLSLERIADVLGFPVLEHLNQNSNPQAPGQLDQHYSPRCKLIALNTIPAADIDPSVSIIYFSKQEAQRSSDYNSSDGSDYYLSDGSHYYLSDSGDVNQAASNLFSTLRRLDQDNQKIAYFEWAPNEGLGRAINDRLQRAAFQP